MSEKKRVNKPIQIALTEDQIANIIQEAARSRRNLRVENLEERIAPSRFGLPVFGGAEVGLEGEPPVDPNHTPPDPNAGFGGGETIGGGDPTTIGGGDPTIDPSNPFDPNAPVDPNNPFDPNNPVDPNNPFDPSNPVDPNAPIDPMSNMDPNDPNAMMNPFNNPNFDPNAMMNPELNPNFDPNAAFDPNQGGQLPGNMGIQGLEPEQIQQMEQQIQDQINQQVTETGSAPTESEIAEHRQNIIRQLRGL